MVYDRSDEWKKLQQYIDNIVASSNAIDTIYIISNYYSIQVFSTINQVEEFDVARDQERNMFYLLEMVESLFSRDYLEFKNLYKESMTVEIDRTEGNSLIDIWTFYFIQIDSKKFSIVFYGTCRKEKSAIHKVTSLKCQNQIREILKKLVHSI
ncbi:hypothetical protein VB774_16540 [Pseudanabaena galeata UHCC 0370]|uniref:Uncharacterized protein n=1 Tax=Pseudanabaena galeata UHCC 0370 TaxID=3110310 RepID=A0ABU5TLQ6_9CYAN|nr:hypothetical protein [Pseudanabaena galeata]MEA5479231.1 hypothetical protein [Pseudanabaena galeata UHCC 0370]